jgi:hypothetical protein
MNDYCKVAGYPFRYQNFSIDQIDSYQGKSGQNAKAFIDAVLDPSVIGFGTIDDIDQVAGKRGDRQSGGPAGGDGGLHGGLCRGGHGGARQLHLRDVLELPGECRRCPAPAGGGAVSGRRAAKPEDYIDILALLLGKNHAIPVGEHELYAAQEIKKAVAASFEGTFKPHEGGLC